MAPRSWQDRLMTSKRNGVVRRTSSDDYASMFLRGSWARHLKSSPSSTKDHHFPGTQLQRESSKRLRPNYRLFASPFSLITPLTSEVSWRSSVPDAACRQVCIARGTISIGKNCSIHKEEWNNLGRMPS